MEPGDENRDPLTVFELISKLGEGSYGSVIKARHRKSGQLFAIKYARARAHGRSPSDPARWLTLRHGGVSVTRPAGSSRSRRMRASRTSCARSTSCAG